MALILVAGAALSTPALSAGAREALGGLTSADDAFTHDSGAVSICKGGSFPGCKGGRAFYCPAGGECEETPASSVIPTGANHSTGAVLDPGVREPALFGMGFVNAGRLQEACRLVQGDFQRTGSFHSCVKPACAKSDIACIVSCKDGKCLGGMPDKPRGAMTLLGILQNGDSTDRSQPSASSGGDGGGGGTSGPGEAKPAEPVCNGGCGTIY
ncbi:MAG: hypothetical protein EOP19_04825 [Hyphomicrobiales bacterium]|nr:MAG: hypothetical protein EOP19_04825 [Hyphomicrobiales bacterium]